MFMEGVQVIVDEIGRFLPFVLLVRTAFARTQRFLVACNAKRTPRFTPKFTHAAPFPTAASARILGSANVPAAEQTPGSEPKTQVETMRAEAPDSPSLGWKPAERLAQCSAPATIEPYEEFSESEKRLNEFLTLHPMLSLDATSGTSLKLVSEMFQDRDRARVDERDLVCIPKSHDDRFLRPPNIDIGERPCVCEDTCICKFMADFRYGEGSKFAFVCTEFLTPKQQAAFLHGEGLPRHRGKCLICLRYFQTYIYTLSRTDPNFRLIGKHVSTQDFCNMVSRSGSDELQKFWALQPEAQHFFCEVGTWDGYSPSALLYVDEEYTKQLAGNKGPMATAFWRPQVKFSSRHYVFETRNDGQPYVSQTGVSSEASTNAYFQQPPPTNRELEGATYSVRST